MSFGMTAPLLSHRQLAERREEKRLARLRAEHGVCKTGGHIMVPGNRHFHEHHMYCWTCVRAGTIKLTSTRWVYFIGDGEGYVKIGFTAQLHGRLAELQSGNARPLTVLKYCRGGLVEERELHRRFAEHRVRGEWFRLAPEIVEHINSLPWPDEPEDEPPAPEVKPEKARVVPPYVRIQQELYAKHQQEGAPA